MRQALNSLAIIAPQWLKPRIQSEWPERYNRPFGEYPIPKAEREIVELAETIGRDGFQLLTSIFNDEVQGLQGVKDLQWLRQVPAVQILHQVWTQNFYHEDGQIRWRRKGSKLPSAVQIRTPHDPEARFSHKRMTEWEGYKVHLTETCNEDAPLLITHVQTTEATLQDVSVVDKIHDDLAQLELLPDEHLVDLAYVSSDVLVTSEQMSVDLIGPVRSDNSWQAHDPQAFDSSRFRIDWEAKVATCPQGKTSHSWVQCTDWRDKPAVHAVFRTSDCQACSVRDSCTKSRYRTLTLQQQGEYLALQRARERQQTDDFRERYQSRAGMEGTISQAMYARKGRRARYRGLAKTHLQHVALAAGINLTRAVDWLWERPRAKTRVAPFVTLAGAA